MHLVKPMLSKIFICTSLLLLSLVSHSQENSPFSRYGIGDIYPQQNITSRGMGGISAAYSNAQAINTINPASYGNISIVTYDFSLSVDSRSLLSNSPVEKYNSVNFSPSYLQLGVPLSKKGWGLVFGIRPASRINYSVSNGTSIHYDSLGTTDSLHQTFEGNGGLNQVFFGLGKIWRGKKIPTNSFSIGFNAGYEWGAKYISTQIDFPSDSSYENWYRSNTTDTTHFYGMFVSPGIMASITLKQTTNPVSKIKNSYVLVVGGSGTLQQNLNASKSSAVQTFYLDDNGAMVPVDSILKEPQLAGKINIPFNFNGGFMLNKMLTNGPFQIKKWGIGADYSFAQWSKYTYFGSPDQVNDSWMIRAGAEFSPNPFSNRNIFKTGTYRLGYYTGKDYINADGNGYKVHAFTLGYSFNLRKYHTYDNQFTMINTAIEVGKRGSNVNNISENFFKFSLGLSLSDIWFIKRKYD